MTALDLILESLAFLLLGTILPVLSFTVFSCSSFYRENTVKTNELFIIFFLEQFQLKVN